MSASLHDRVVEALRTAERPLRTPQLAQKLGLTTTLALGQILRKLQKRRAIEQLKGGQWRWTGLYVPDPPQQPPPGATPPPEPLDPGSAPQRPPANSGSRWETFRALCRYYAECVRLEESAQLSVYADQHHREFVELTRDVDWSALSRGEPCRLRLDQEQLVFVRRGLGLKRHPHWFLGGPVDLYSDVDRTSNDRWTKLRPVLVMPLQPELDGRTLVLKPIGPVEINHGWLQQKVRKPDHRHALLAALGLADDLGARAADSRHLIELPVVDFAEAYKALWIGYRDWWQERGDLSRRSTAPSLERVTTNGIYNRALLIVGPALRYGRRVVEELYELADQRSDEELDQTALTELFPHEPPRGTRGAAEGGAATDALTAEYAHLNDEQRAAVQRALADPLTVVTGPPGTGKSVVVAHVMLNLALANRSALFASRNHQAIEAVEPRLNALVEPEMLVMRPSRPFQATAQQQHWQQALTELLSKPKPEDALDELARLQAQLHDLLGERADVERDAAARLDLQQELTEVELALQKQDKQLAGEHRELVWKPGAGLPDAATLEAIRAKLEAWLVAQRAPGLKNALRRAWRVVLRRFGRDPVRGLVYDARGALASVQALAGPPSALPEHPVELVAHLAAWLPLLHARALAAQITQLRAQVEALPDHEATTDALRRLQDSVQTRTVDVAKAFARATGSEVAPEQRQRFAELRAGQENHRGSPSEAAFQKAFSQALPELLAHFPLWATSNQSAYKAAALSPALFDLLIIDEASQCDIGSVIPLLFRARRALVVGDPMQLRHISQLPRESDLQLRARLGLVDQAATLERFATGSNSLYDLAASSERIASPLGLRAHYRCHPEIAGFCNQSFYGNQLRVMTDRHRLQHVPGAADALRGVEWTQARGPITRASRGCYSDAITGGVIAELEKLSGLDFEGTVGVVTPFKAQADRIRDEAFERIDRQRIERWRLLVHTVDGFQGDERDVVLFALTGGPDMPPGSRGFLGSTPNRCNVAVSRARSFLRVVGDRSWAATCGIPFVQALEQACTQSEAGPRNIRHDLIGPVWEPLLAEALREAGIEFFQQYLTCGYYLDFAVLEGGRKLNIEVDGETYHRGVGGERQASDLYRDFTLRSAGWEVLRFWVYELREDLSSCIEKIRCVYGPAK